jgi:hypothetical protein
MIRLSGLLATVGVTGFALLAGSVPAIEGLPHVEEFTSTTYQDASVTTARWSSGEALTLAWRDARYGAFSAGNTTAVNISDEALWASSVALGDVDGDGDIDLIVGTRAADYSRLFLNNGTASPFNGVNGVPIVDGPYHTGSIALGDMDGDGDLDLIAGNGEIDIRNRLLLNNGTADPFNGVTGTDITTDEHYTQPMALGDLDGDGDLDLVVGNLGGTGQVNRVYLNNGTANPFSGGTGSNITDDADVTTSVALGDVDGDGDLDLAVGNAGLAGAGNVNGLYLNNGTSNPFSGVASSEISFDSDITQSVTLGQVEGRSPGAWRHRPNGLRCGRAVAQRTVGSMGVVVESPPFDQDLCLKQGVEDLAVQELISELAVERLDVAVFPGRARLDEEGVDADASKPFTHRCRREFRAVVGADVGGHAAHDKEPRQAVEHVIVTQLASDIDGQALAGEFVDECEHPQRPAITGARLHEVIRPHMIAMLRPEPHA